MGEPTLLIVAAIGLAAMLALGSCAGSSSTSAGSTTAGFDPARAARNGADEYGMRSYVLALLKAGPNRDQTPDEAERLQRAHLDNISRLAREGVLVLAGPFSGDGPYRGLYVFATSSLEEARALTATDPAIVAGRLEMELIPFYGSAALMEVGDIHRRIAEKDI